MRIDRENNEIVCNTAGHFEQFTISYSRHMCGKITDGVRLQNGKGNGSYVIAFSDLEQAYLEAKNFRDRHPITAKERETASLLENHKST